MPADVWKKWTAVKVTGILVEQTDPAFQHHVHRLE
jgi:hypothetical protein